MNKLSDLRFIIGLFFLITGLLLIGYYFLLNNIVDTKVNLVCGSIFTIFGLLMMIFSDKTKGEGK